MDSVDTRRVNPSIAKNQGPGRLEVLDQKDGFFTDTCLSGSQVRNSESQFCYDKHTTSHHVGKLEVLEPKEEIIYPTGSVPRPRSVVGRTGSPGKKCYTPNKQVSLCVLKPLPQSGDIYDAVEPILPRELDTSMTSVEQATTGSLSQSTQNRSIKNKSPDSSEEDESNDEREGAPTELLAEFLKAVMDKEYKVAQKLCRMILLYEPENTEAKAFSPLIEEMLQIEDEPDSSDDTDDTDDSTDLDDDDDDTDGDSCDVDSDESEEGSTGTSKSSSKDDSDD